jgi:hypothetical protein
MLWGTAAIMSHYPGFVLHNMQNCRPESDTHRMAIVHQNVGLALIKIKLTGEL